MTKNIGLKGADHGKHMNSSIGNELQLTALVDLPGHFSVWLASPEADFLHGKFVCANWDVEELMSRKEEFEKTDLATIRLAGLPSF
jgi:hypothetical protein